MRPATPAGIVGLTLFLTWVLVAVSATMVLASDVYLLAFLAILCGVAFTYSAAALGRVSHLPYGVNLATIVMVSIILFVLTVGWFGIRIERQLEAASDELDASYTQVKQWFDQHPMATSAIRRIPFVRDLLLDAEVRGKSWTAALTMPKKSGGPATHDGSTSSEPSHGSATGVTRKFLGVLGNVFATTFGATTNILFVLFVGVFLAIRPVVYRDGLTMLFPPRTRPRVTNILNELGQTLFRFLQGRAIAMLITGVGTGTVLWILGVPLAMPLGVLTGLLTFIPTIGAILALLLSSLVALSQGPATVLWVVVLYIVFQLIESNVITPLIQQRQTSVPPPLLLAAQLLMGVLLGFLGVLVSTPLVASIILLVREAYIEDILHGDSESTNEMY